MIKYNKKMQNLININPNYIKFYSKKHIIYESKLNDNGSEYNDKFSLIYSGGIAAVIYEENDMDMAKNLMKKVRPFFMGVMQMEKNMEE